MKLIHPILGREALESQPLNKHFSIHDRFGSRVIPTTVFTKDQCLSMGFEEAKEEVEAPEWFKNMEDEYDDFVYDESISVGEKSYPHQLLTKKYQIFLKHYPKQDTALVTLCVEEIAQQINSLYKNSNRYDVYDAVLEVLCDHGITNETKYTQHYKQ